jgi:hypothetical protein
VNEAILKKTRLWTIVVAAGVSLIVWLTVSVHFAAGVFVTALWAVVGFWALDRLLRAALVPPGSRRNIFAVIAWGVAKLTIYGLAIWALLARPFPAISHVIGFTLLLVVLVVIGITAMPRGISQPARRGDDG